jgi:hypothetical protein
MPPVVIIKTSTLNSIVIPIRLIVWGIVKDFKEFKVTINSEDRVEVS